MPRQMEPNTTHALGNLLPRSQVRSENTRAISRHFGLKPDILITTPGRSPVVIEAYSILVGNLWHRLLLDGV